MNRRKTAFGRGPVLIMAAALLAGGLALWMPLEKAEYWFCDRLYIREQPVDNRIKIIGIDEKSLLEMGPFSGWTRQQAADLLNSLDAEYAPAVIAFDINYFGERDAQGDAALAEAAARFRNVVMASHVNYSTRMEQAEDGSLQINTRYVEQLELPYDALLEVTEHGFTDVVLDKDNYVRRSFGEVQLPSAGGDAEYELSFAQQIYALYCAESGEEQFSTPRKNRNGTYGFDYTAEPGMYEVYSYVDVVSGRCDPRVFSGSIVLVGAYSSGMMDQYMVPVARGTVMNGVEVQANHVNALLDGRTYVILDSRVSALISFVVIGFFVWLVCYHRFLADAVGGAVLEAAVPLAARYLYSRGIYWRCFALWITVLFVFLARVAAGYLTERIKKKRILNVFRTYMAPQVVDELGRSGNYQIELGGHDRDIAVLFVDIRGFTALSEELPPDKTVEILNHYLGTVTEAIFRNGGTLDKFIGDAVMAVYNAPLDVKDYVYHAVRTGLDIIDAVDKMNIEWKDRLGAEIACGVGIHCGRAVVGNIGCSYRMDYTAIGDTVNVAERLESIAGSGQILVSRDLYERVKDCCRAVSMGKQSLKGRQDEIEVFLVEDMDEAGADGKNTGNRDSADSRAGL